MAKAIEFTVMCDGRVNSRPKTRQDAVNECGRLARSLVGRATFAYGGATKIAEAYFTRSTSGGVYGEIRECKS